MTKTFKDVHIRTRGVEFIEEGVTTSESRLNILRGAI